jgi:hypothetical protein
VLFLENLPGPSAIGGAPASVLNGGPIPITTGAFGRVVLVATGDLFNTGGSTSEVTVTIFVDGSAVGPQQIVQVPVPINTFDGVAYAMATVIAGLSAGAHTFDVQASTVTGHVSIFGGGGLLAMPI